MAKSNIQSLIDRLNDEDLYVDVVDEVAGMLRQVELSLDDLEKEVAWFEHQNRSKEIVGWGLLKSKINHLIAVVGRL